MTNLKDINFGINQYCGPAVLSALTGESTDKCAAVISAVTGRREIKAVKKAELKEAFKRLQFDIEDTIFLGSTLYGTLHRMHTYDGLYVVFVPHHVVAVEIKEGEVYICDNHTKRPMDIKQSARLTQKVEAVWKVIPKKPPVFVGSSIRLDKRLDKIEIVRVNMYEDPKDNIEYIIGDIHYKSRSELGLIVGTLGLEYEEGIL